MNTILKQLLTGKDNQTHDLVRWLGTIVVFTALTLTIYIVLWRGQAFRTPSILLRHELHLHHSWRCIEAQRND